MRIKLVVGLGNPGNIYNKTRHNAGFMAIDRLLKKYEINNLNKKKNNKKKKKYKINK